MIWKPTNHQITKGILNHKIKIYTYLDKKYRPIAIAHVRANSGTKEDGEELYDDVLLKIYDNIKKDKYDPDGGSFDGYFKKIMRGKWIDKLRKIEKDINTTELKDAIQQNLTLPKDEVDLAWVKFLHKYLNRLKPDDFKIVRLFYFENVEQKEIGKIIGKTTAYVKLRLYRIREKLKEWLNNDPDFNFNIPK